MTEPTPQKISPLLRFRRNTAVRRFGKSVEHGFKHLLIRLLHFGVHSTPVDPHQLPDIRRVLFVRPNFRIGNLLIGSALLPALRERFPDATIDYLGGDTNVSLLKNYRFNQVFLLSRSFILRPWGFVSLFRQLRKQKYDLAIEPSNGSFSALMYMRLSGARYRMGGGKWSTHLCNIAVQKIKGGHAYDGVLPLAQALGVPVRDHPYYTVTPEEHRKAISTLTDIHLADGQDPLPFIALFAGGHQDKRWPMDSWVELAGNLHQAGVRSLLLLGPEERHFGPVFRTRLGPSIPVLDPLPLRDFAAVLQQARMMVTPDSGPMHLAVGLDVPTVALLQKEMSTKFQPRGERDVILAHASAQEVLQTLKKHSLWPVLTHTAI